MRHAEIKQDKEQDLETSDRSLGNGLIGRLFTNHSRRVGKTYSEHMGFAMGVAGSLFLAGAATFIHALVPALCQTSARNRITRLTTRVLPREKAYGRYPKSKAAPGSFLVSVIGTRAQHIVVTLYTIEHLLYVWMVYRPVATIQHKVLLADIGGVIAVRIFCEQMIEGLRLVGSHLCGNGFIPFVRVVVLWVNINNNTAKRIQPMANNRPDAKLHIAVFLIFFGHDCQSAKSDSRIRRSLTCQRIRSGL